MTCSGGDLPVRRLTRTEYDNTLRDILGDTSSPARAFPADVAKDGFTNDRVGLTVPFALVQKHEVAVETVIAGAWERGALKPCATAPVPAECATAALRDLARRAWRRDVVESDLTPLLALLDALVTDGHDFDESLQVTERAVLLDPEFLFRIERSNSGSVDGFAVASRLSYFLWSSAPDEALLSAAAAGQLASAKQREAQARRMLGDGRSEALISNMFSEWFGTRNVEGIAPDSAIYGEVNPELKRAMRDETDRFLAEFLKGESMAQLLTAPFTFVGPALAEHYGLPPGAPASDRLDTSGHPERQGLLGQASFLATTSLSTRTSPVLRGAWILERLLCDTPPPPPPNVPALPDQEVASGATIRELSEAHRASPACSQCHSVMDPLGFAFENYDAIARWRTEDAGQPIDSTGEYEGTRFTTPWELTALLAADPRYPACVVEKINAFARGRTLSKADAGRVEALTEDYVRKGQSLPDLIVSIASSEDFGSACF